MNVYGRREVKDQSILDFVTGYTWINGCLCW